ncbi:MAG: histidine kinase dimerization/phospho-acceptor domain-containing protein, partial [Miltoncostaeaceae bacterium]
MRARRASLALGLQGWLAAAFLLVGVIASLTIVVVVLPTLESSVREDRAKRESDRLGALLRGELESRLLRDPVGVEELRTLAQDLRAATGADIRLTYRPGDAFVRVETTVQWPPNEAAGELLDQASGLSRGYSADGRLAAPLVRLTSQSSGAVLLVRGAQTLSGIAPELAIVRRRVIVAMVLVLSLASLMGVLLARRLGGHMRELSRTAATLAGGDLGARSPELGLVPTALVVLRDSLDGMASRLQSFVGAITDERDRDRAMVGSLAEGVVTVAPDDTVMVANDAANRMLGLPEGAERGRLESLPPALMDAVRSSRAGREVGESEVALPGGLELEVHVAPMAGRDEGGTVVTLRDVTDERRLERARRDLVANVSHELKTPIAALKGFLELLEDDRVGAADRREFMLAMS